MPNLLEQLFSGDDTPSLTVHFRDCLETGRALVASGTFEECFEHLAALSQVLLRPPVWVVDAESNPIKGVGELQRCVLSAPVLLEEEAAAQIRYGEQGEVGERLAFLTTLAAAAFANARTRLKHETALRQAQAEEERFAQLFHHGGVPTALVDNDWTVSLANEALADLAGRPLDGLPLLDCLFYQDRDLVCRGESSEVRLVRPDGALIWVELVSSDTGVVTLTNISHRRLEQLLHFQRAERAILAAELHDTVAQELGALHFMAMANDASEESDICKAALDNLVHLMARLRAGDQPLEGALRTLFTGLNLEYEIHLSGQPDVLDIFRFVEELALEIAARGGGRACLWLDGETLKMTHDAGLLKAEWVKHRLELVGVRPTIEDGLIEIAF